MFCTIKLKRLKKPVFCILIAVLLLMLFSFFKKERTVEAFEDCSSHCLVIDPGHGGIDGGAVAISGVKESNVNLSISKRLQALAALYGEKTIMTRSDDSARTDAQTYSEHEDLVFRAGIVNSAVNPVLISVHQNCYPTSQPYGAQVLYAPSEGSESLGYITHGNIISNLEPDNRRVAEPAGNSLYLTANVKCPAILVECGFMSNFSDLEKLTDGDYQIQFSAVLLASYLQYRWGSI